MRKRVIFFSTNVSKNLYGMSLTKSHDWYSSSCVSQCKQKFVYIRIPIVRWYALLERTPIGNCDSVLGSYPVIKAGPVITTPYTIPVANSQVQNLTFARLNRLVKLTRSTFTGHVEEIPRQKVLEHKWGQGGNLSCFLQLVGRPNVLFLFPTFLLRFDPMIFFFI